MEKIARSLQNVTTNNLDCFALGDEKFIIQILDKVRLRERGYSETEASKKILKYFETKIKQIENAKPNHKCNCNK